MGGSVNDPNLANEWRYPGQQATQPLARLNDGQSAMSSTESLGSDFFGEGGLGGLLQRSVGNDTIPNYNSDTTGGGFSSFAPSSSNSPFNAVPDSSGGTAPQQPTGGSSGSWTNSGMGGSSNSGNILSGLSDAYGGMGGVFNKDFFSHNTTPEGGVNNTSWTDSNSLFSGDSLFGSAFGKEGQDALGTLGFGSKVAGAFGYGNQDLNNALSIANASPRSMVNAYANYSGNAALGMLTGDFSQRGIVNSALHQTGVPYGGSIMGLADYGMGYNNYGAAASTIGGMFGPVGSALGGLFGHNLQGYYGADADATTVDKYNESYLSKYNDNYGTFEGDAAANQYARDYGLAPGTHEFDRVVDGFKVAYDKNPDFRTAYEQDYPTPVTDSKAGTITPINNVQDAIANKVPYGQEGDDTWTDGTTTFHSGGYNWNGDANTGSDSFGNDIGAGTDFSAAPAADLTEDYGSGWGSGDFGGSDYGDDAGSDDGGYGDDSDDGGAGWGGNDGDW